MEFILIAAVYPSGCALWEIERRAAQLGRMHSRGDTMSHRFYTHDSPVKTKLGSTAPKTISGIASCSDPPVNGAPNVSPGAAEKAPRP